MKYSNNKKSGTAEKSQVHVEENMKQGEATIKQEQFDESCFCNTSAEVAAAVNSWTSERKSPSKPESKNGDGDNDEVESENGLVGGVYPAEDDEETDENDEDVDLAVVKQESVDESAPSPDNTTKDVASNSLDFDNLPPAVSVRLSDVRIEFEGQKLIIKNSPMLSKDQLINTQEPSANGDHLLVSPASNKRKLPELRPKGGELSPSTKKANLDSSVQKTTLVLPNPDVSKGGQTPAVQSKRTTRSQTNMEQLASSSNTNKHRPNGDHSNSGQMNKSPSPVLQTNIEKANKSPTSLAPTSLGLSNLGLTNLAPSNLAPTNLAPANLAPANLTSINLAPANLAPANLAPANLAPANLAPANLAPANLAATNLAPANLASTLTNMCTSNTGPAVIGHPNVGPSNVGQKLPPLDEQLQFCMDRHVAFFKSVHPSLQTLNEQEILQYQASVLATLQNIQQSRMPVSAPAPQLWPMMNWMTGALAMNSKQF